MVKIAFVNFASNSYIPLQKSLKLSIQKSCPSADIFLFNTFEEIRSPSHTESPYAFKIYSIEYVRDLGYDIIIWLDSCQRLVKDPVHFIKDIQTVGVYLQRDGWLCGQWANDKSLNYFNITRDEAMNIPNIYACIIGFDFRHPIANTFISEWKKCQQFGLFFGKWNNKEKTESQDERCLGHRHDQTCAELIANKLSIPLMPRVVDDIFKGWMDFNYNDPYVTRKKINDFFKTINIR